MRRLTIRLLLVLQGIALAACSGAKGPRVATSIGPEAGYESIAEELDRVIRHEIEDKGVPALSIALVDDQRTVWANGFGHQDAEGKIPATAATVYRVGSVSKLFTDLAVMQRVETGRLDLDAPISQSLPSFQPENPFGTPQTIRQMMSHRSGLVREPPNGSYFDPEEPSLAQTIASLNATRLVYPPGTRTKYSNAAVGTLGFILEKKEDKPFEDIVQASILDAVGMPSSSFRLNGDIQVRLAEAIMWGLDGREFPAPVFKFGMAPAANLYSTAEDMGRFIQMLLAEGKTSDGTVLLEPETLRRMYQPQFASEGSAAPYGLGFRVSQLDGHRMVGHGGAVYGFATQLSILPDERLGVIATASRDVANDLVDRIASYALRLMLAKKGVGEAPAWTFTEPIQPDRMRELAGHYVSTDDALDLKLTRGELRLRHGFRDARLRRLGDQLIVDDPLVYGGLLSPIGDGHLRFDDEEFRRAPLPKPADIPSSWKGLIGEYGWDHNTLFILEKEGKLQALIEWFFLYPLTPDPQDPENTFDFPDYGLYSGERVVFQRDGSGVAERAFAAGVRFERGPPGSSEGGVFRIDPIRPVERLRKEALAAEPPTQPSDLRQPDLLLVSGMDPSIRFDIRYATRNNFMGEVFYERPLAFLQRPAAAALLKAHLWLRERGYGLLIHDAYRPWYVTKMFWDATPDNYKIFVADPATGSRHNRGAAVDLTLYDLAAGEPIRMTGGYDEFSDRSYPDYPGGTSLQRWHRDLLRRAMESQGFDVYSWEWWHYDFQDWQEYPVLNLTFDKLMKE